MATVTLEELDARIGGVDQDCSDVTQDIQADVEARFESMRLALETFKNATERDVMDLIERVKILESKIED